MGDQLAETWAIHDRVNLYLLRAVPADALGATIGPKFRTVGGLFAHVHNVRLMWLKSAAPDLLDGLAKVEGADADKAGLEAALTASGRAVGELVRRAVAAGGKVKGFKPHVVAFVGYLIAHESHHRGQVG
ncbi:MAG: DinB family protein [Gemmataceae bacterium]|nr:DinB family protein [Gemmataceae bacterium]